MNIGPNGQLLQGGFSDEESDAKSYRQGLLSRTSRLGVEPDPGCINRDLIIKHPTNGLSSERSRSKVYKRVTKTEQSMSPLIEFAFWCAFWVLISGPLVKHRSCLLIPTVQSNSSHSGGHLEMAWQRVNTSGHQTKEYNGLRSCKYHYWDDIDGRLFWGIFEFCIFIELLIG